MCPQFSPANGKNYYRNSNLALCFHAVEEGPCNYTKDIAYKLAGLNANAMHTRLTIEVA